MQIDLKVQRATHFFRSLGRHSGIFVQPLAFPDSSLLYFLIWRGTGLGLFIVIVDHVDQTARVYYEENGVPTFRLATFTVTNVEVAALGRPKLDGYKVRVASAVVGQPILDEPEDHVASNGDLRTALRDHYRSILQVSAAGQMLNVDVALNR